MPGGAKRVLPFWLFKNRPPVGLLKSSPRTNRAGAGPRLALAAADWDTTGARLGAALATDATVGRGAILATAADTAGLADATGTGAVLSGADGTAASEVVAASWLEVPAPRMATNPARPATRTPATAPPMSNGALFEAVLAVCGAAARGTGGGATWVTVWGDPEGCTFMTLRPSIMRGMIVSTPSG